MVVLEMEPQSIRQILQNVMDQSGINEKLEDYKALQLWYDVASNLASRTEPVGISQGKLLVNVTDSVVLHQLTFYKRKYVDKINSLLGMNVIKDVVFRVGKVSKKRDIVEKREDYEDYMEMFKSIQLDQELLARINKIVSQIEDKELRDSLRDLFINQSKLDKVRNVNS